MTENEIIKTKRVLILEYDPLAASLFKAIFEDYGYDVQIVNTMAKCLEKAILFNPSLIIMRYLFEGGTADRLVATMREMPYLKDKPILVYTNTLLGGEEEKLEKAGTRYFLTDTNGIKLLKKTNEILKM